MPGTQKVRKCTISKDQSSCKRCKKPHFATVRVRVFHQNSNRRTWQTWYFCKEHFEQFEKDKGNGWRIRYRDESKPDSPVIEYEVI